MDNTVSKKTKPAKKGIHFKNKKIRNSLFIIGGLLAAMIIVYLVGSFYFNQRF